MTAPTTRSTDGTFEPYRCVAVIREHAANVYRVEIHLERKELVEAERLLRRLLEDRPDDVWLNILLCRCLIETGPAPHFEEIEARLSGVLRAADHSRHGETNYLIGVVLRLRGDDRAAAFFEKAVEVDRFHRGARREVRIHAMRREHARRANSLVGRLTTWISELLGREK